MFYQGTPDRSLRFGDVVKGYILANATLATPVWDSPYTDFSVNVRLPKFSVIMTPCCSIEDKTIALAPLVQVYPAFFDNPYLAEDLTRINRIMTPEQSVSAIVWEQLGNEERTRRLAEGNTYAFINHFIYQKHDSFPEYTLHRRTKDDLVTNYHMVDFRNIYRVNCEKIITPSNSPIESKHLQLSIEIRRRIAR